MTGLSGDARRKRVALVTGGNRGIGLAVASRLADEGVELAIMGLEADEVQEAARRLRRAEVRVFPAPADLRRVDEIAPALDRILDYFDGTIDILVSNAGFNDRKPDLRSIDLASWQDVITCNLTAPFLLARTVSDGMIRQRWGRIVLISAIQAWSPLPGNVAYASAKAGLFGLTRGLARDLTPYGITTNCVAVGPVSDEPSADHDWPTLTGRRGLPTEIAPLVAFLVSDPCTFMTGSVIRCDGGRLFSRKPEID